MEEQRRQANLDVVRRFFTENFRQRREKKIISDDFVIELPFAPPGMPTRAEGEALERLSHWVGGALHNWHQNPAPVIHATDDPARFWVESGSWGQSRWGGRDGYYGNSHVALLELRDEQVVLFREYFNPLRHYQSIGTPILAFAYLQ